MGGALDVAPFELIAATTDGGLVTSAEMRVDQGGKDRTHRLPSLRILATKSMMCGNSPMDVVEIKWSVDGVGHLSVPRRQGGGQVKASSTPAWVIQR